MPKRISRVTINRTRYQNAIEKLASDFVRDPDAVKTALRQMKSGHAVFIDIVDFLTDKREMHRQGYIDLNRINAGWSNVKNWGKDKFNQAVDWGAQNWQNLENTVTDQVTEFSNQLQQVPGQVQDALTPNWWSNIWNFQNPNALPAPSVEDATFLENWNFEDSTTQAPLHPSTGLPSNLSPDQFLEQNPQMATDVPTSQETPLDPTGYPTTPVDEVLQEPYDPDTVYENYFTAPAGDDMELSQILPGIGYDMNQTTAMILKRRTQSRRNVILRGFKRLSNVLGEYEN